MEAASTLVKNAGSVLVVGMEKVFFFFFLFFSSFSKKRYHRFLLKEFLELILEERCKNFMNQKVLNSKWKVLLKNFMV